MRKEKKKSERKVGRGVVEGSGGGGGGVGSGGGDWAEKSFTVIRVKAFLTRLA